MSPIFGAPGSTDMPCTRLAGSSTALASPSIDKRPPPCPPYSPTAASITGAGKYPSKLDGTGFWAALSGFGSDALIALTRNAADTCPNPPSVPAAPSTGLPPLTIMPASGWNALVASTIVLHAACAWAFTLWHWGSWAARGRGADSASTASETSDAMYAFMVPPLPFREPHAGLARVHFTNHPGRDLGTLRSLYHGVH